MTSRTHLDLDEWRAFLEQTMSAADREVALDHISSCPRCADVFKAARSAALSSMPESAFTPEPAASPLRVLVPIATVMVIGVVSAVIVMRQPVPVSEPAAPTLTATPAPAPAPEVTARPPAIAKPPVVIGAEQLLAPRGDDNQTKYLQALADALKPYESDRFGDAIALLEPLAKAHPDRFEPVFYLGASLLMNGRAADAVPVLTSAVAIASPARRADAERLLAAAQAAAKP